MLPGEGDQGAGTDRLGHPGQPLPVGNKGARAFRGFANQRGTALW